MYGLPSEEEAAQEALSREIDAEAARVIRECGIPLWDAIEQAKKNIQRRRRFGKWKEHNDANY